MGKVIRYISMFLMLVSLVSCNIDTEWNSSPVAGVWETTFHPEAPVSYYVLLTLNVDGSGSQIQKTIEEGKETVCIEAGLSYVIEGDVITINFEEKGNPVKSYEYSVLGDELTLYSAGEIIVWKKVSN